MSKVCVGFGDIELDYGNVGVLSLEETKSLFSLRDSADKKVSNNAVTKLVSGNAGLVYKIAKSNKYINQGLDSNDLILSGMEGLYKAIMKADVNEILSSSANIFAGYASRLISGAIVENLRICGNSGKTMSDGAYKKTRQLHATASALKDMSSSEIDTDTLYKKAAEYVGITEDKAQKLRDASSMAVELDAPFDGSSEESDTLLSIYEGSGYFDTESCVERNELQDLLYSSFDNLTEVERDIIERAYGFRNEIYDDVCDKDLFESSNEYTKTESFANIARSYGRTRAWASGKCKDAVRKLREMTPELEYYF